jgi:H/ACA ribonucleoprotein complex subunit 4
LSQLDRGSIPVILSGTIEKGQSTSNAAFITKVDEPSDPAYGFDPNKRPIRVLLDYGFIPVDKPIGPTSHEVVAWVKKIVGCGKAGHSGTLDPPVSGVLPVGLNEATKALGVLLHGSKEYYAVARIHDPVDHEKLHSVLSLFNNADVYQRPPQRSSVKRVTRTRRIYSLEVVEEKGRLLVLRVECEAGTYIRKLVYDIGEILGVGATMVELRRTRVSHIDELSLFTLHEVYDAISDFKEKGTEEKIRRVVRPVEEMLYGVKRVFLRDSAVNSVCHGAQLAVPGVTKVESSMKKGEEVVMLTGKGELIALGQSLMDAEELVKSEKGIAVKVNRVIMKAETYPKMWRSSSSRHPCSTAAEIP